MPVICHTWSIFGTFSRPKGSSKSARCRREVSNLGHRDLMTEIGTKVSQRSTKFTPGQLAHITWAFGALSLKQPGCRYRQFNRGNVKPEGNTRNHCWLLVLCVKLFAVVKGRWCSSLMSLKHVCKSVSVSDVRAWLNHTESH